MRIALDTNRYVDFARGEPAAVRVLESVEEILLSFVALAELRAGFLGGTRAAENEQVLNRFLARPDVSVLYADDQTTRYYASLTQQLRKQGTPIPSNDIWIAALALQHNLALFARDAHFDHLPQLHRA